MDQTRPKALGLHSFVELKRWNVCCLNGIKRHTAAKNSNSMLIKRMCIVVCAHLEKLTAKGIVALRPLYGVVAIQFVSVKFDSPCGAYVLGVLYMFDGWLLFFRQARNER